ncbi:GNAT family N-acetyltransferase [Streptomyces litchfieldiae]|uniref:GNAT family N-acetyltransferase n=1 Tax=Streptomyces litchfieldiae TaxID=3075543 RepID=A0ABU2MYF2_9ACTN|nr:GNAT family N-acetyltransferase [Streptomyces sp. DSM 44938]MDT0346654.1 GNAT family N-acetyltransferase [Streptomyces sp. DSM 44938]
MTYTIRQTRREDWERLRELRLAALQDPIAPMAFYEPYEEAVRLTRGEWERRASGRESATFIGEAESGSWGGMVGAFVKHRVVHVVGVYMLPEHRGTGLARELMRAAIEWAGGHEVRLRVHENNKRAARFYESLGFRPTGGSDADPRDPALRAFELSLKTG